MNKLRSEIIKNIRSLVESKRHVKSYAELARLISTDATQMNKWLQGVNSFPVEFPEDCARAMKVPLSTIIPADSQIEKLRLELVSFALTARPETIESVIEQLESVIASEREIHDKRQRPAR